MQSTAFEESNAIRDTPEGVDPDAVSPLPVWVGSDEGGLPTVICCFKPTQAEIDEIQRTGRVWCHILGDVVPPIHLGTAFPFRPAGDRPLTVPQALQVDPRRTGTPETGVYVRAQLQGAWGSHDIAHLTAASLLDWLRSGGRSELAEDLVGMLLGHGPGLSSGV